MGIGRTFTYGGARERDMPTSVKHFHEKLVHLASYMRTSPGRRMAWLRIGKIREFIGWWDEELDGSDWQALDCEREGKSCLRSNGES